MDPADVRLRLPLLQERHDPVTVLRPDQEHAPNQSAVGNLLIRPANRYRYLPPHGLVVRPQNSWLNRTRSADAAFLSRENCDLVTEAGATPRIVPKRNVTLNPGGSKAWGDMLDAFLDHTQERLHEYHPRSGSECHWSRDKARHGPLRRRLDRRRGLERHARFTEGNLARLALLRRLGEVRIPWTGPWAV